MLAWTKTTIAQHSFEIILEVESESLLNVTSLIETSNGDFVGKFSRVLYNDSLNTWDEYLIQISPIGDTATYLFKKEDTLLYFDKIIQVNDNPIQYFVQGMLFETDQTEWKHEWFSLLDESFNIIWEKIYKLSGRTFGFSTSDIIHLSDGSFLYARYPGDSQYMYIFHLAANGDSLHFRAYEEDSAGQVMSLTYSPDSSAFWLHTHLAHYDPTGPESQVIVIDNELEQTKVMYYPRWFSENYYAKVLPDNKLVAGGRYFDFDNSYLTAYIVDTGLNVLYEHNLTHPDTNTAAIGQCVDYYYPDQIFVGGTHNNGAVWGTQPTWFIIAKYNAELNLIYEHYLGGDANYWLYNTTATSDSGVLLSGVRYDHEEPITRKKAIIIKLNSDGILVGSQDAKTTIPVTKALVYPNPGANDLFIRTAIKDCTFYLFNANGTLLLKRQLNDIVTHVKTNNLPPGSYIYQIATEQRLVESGAWIKK